MFFEPMLFGRRLMYPDPGAAGGGSSGGSKEGGTGGGSDKDPGQKGGTGGSTEDPGKDGKKDKDPEGQGDGKVEDLPPWAQKLVKDLRKENADHRTKNKGFEDRFNKLEAGLKGLFGGDNDDKLTPEQRVEQLTEAAQQAEMKNAVLLLAMENGIATDKIDYLGYKINQAMASLDDGQELPDEELAKIVKEVKGLGGGSPGKGKADSSVDDKDANNKDPNSSKGVTLDEFINMGVMAKSELYRKDKATYDRLFAEAKSKGQIR